MYSEHGSTLYTVHCTVYSTVILSVKCSGENIRANRSRQHTNCIHVLLMSNFVMDMINGRANKSKTALRTKAFKSIDADGVSRALVKEATISK